MPQCLVARVGLTVCGLMSIAVLTASAVQTSTKELPVLSTPLTLRKASFDLRKRDNLPAIIKALDEDIDYWTVQRDKKKDETRPTQRPNLKDVVKELKAMRKIAKSMQDGSVGYELGARTLLELDWTMRDEFTPQFIARPHLDIAQLFYRFRYYTLNPVGRGNSSTPARNLSTTSGDDLSRVDPLPSSFWTKPASISEKDLFFGFGRKSVPTVADKICTYDGPHLGYGFHPSFDVKTPDGRKWRTKFGERAPRRLALGSCGRSVTLRKFQTTAPRCA